MSEDLRVWFESRPKFTYDNKALESWYDDLAAKIEAAKLVVQLPPQTAREDREERKDNARRQMMSTHRYGRHNKRSYGYTKSFAVVITRK